jgi:uncharacterized protein YndB with AHSA1/START domain
MPTTRVSRTIPASAQELWEVISDPHHLPRWWPRVSRVESVEQHAFTEVLATSSGKLVRADFELLDSDEHSRSLRWSQHIDGTPFARVLKAAETMVCLQQPQHTDTLSDPVQKTEVTIELRQSLRGFFPRFGSRMMRRAAATTLEEALDGLERIVGR